MAIRDAELEVVRRVLNGKDSRAWAAQHHDNRLRLLLAVAIMQGAEVKDAELIEGQGIYGDLIYELAVRPAVPANGWPRDEHGGLKAPKWHEGIWPTNFVTVSGTQGFHKPQPRSRGTHAVSFVGSEQFNALLDPKTRAKCRQWFNEARRAVVARNEKEAAEAKARKAATAKLQDGLGRIIREHNVTLTSPRSTGREHVEALVADLQKLLKDTQL